MKKGFTLIEVLIAMSLFTVAVTIASTILVDIVKLEKKSDIQNAIYEDARILMQQIVNEIKAGTIDYEEYFSVNVVQNGADPKFYGINYGIYASRFYDPGRSLDTGPDPISNPEDLGVECSVQKPAPDTDECEVIYNLSSDLNTGQNPFEGSGLAGNEANAFCHKGHVTCKADQNIVDELYLIDSSGTRKTIIAKKLMKDSEVKNFSIAMVRMTGSDYDQNGIVDVFTCDEGYSCTEHGNGGGKVDFKTLIKYPMATTDAFFTQNKITLPTNSDLDKPFTESSQFVPLSPSRSNVEQLKFIIRPLEDPYKAYAEKDMQSHPSVTILLTLGLSDNAKREYPGEFQSITIQTTVAAGVRGKIDSYPPVTDFINPVTGVDSWILKVFGTKLSALKMASGA